DARRAVLDARRNFDGERAFGLREAASAAAPAGLHCDLTGAAAARAGGLDRDRDQRLLDAHARAPAARASGCEARHRRAAHGDAGVAQIGALVLDDALAAERRLFEAELERLAQIAAVARANPERAQQIAEDFVDAAEVEVHAGHGAGAKRGFAVAIEGGAFVRI